MKLPQCEREQEVLDALRSGRWASGWGEEIRRHVAGCPVCAEVVLVAREFQREAELASTELQPPGAGLPSAGRVWWKAQLAARRAAERRAAEPIVLVERVAWALGVLTAVGVGKWQRPRLAAWFHHGQTSVPLPAITPGPASLLHAGWLHRLALAWTGQTALFLLAVSAAAFFTVLVFAAYMVWREE